MVFTTLTFFIFLAIVFTGYWALRERRQQNLLLIAASYVFYGWWDWRFCILMAVSTLVDFFMAWRIDATDAPSARRWLMAVSICVNLGLLCFFKYFNFFAASFQEAAAALGWTVYPVTLHVLLPVGISFYTFQTLSYTLDVYARRMRATRSLVDYLAFVSFFPQLVAGPIERAIHLLPQFQRERRFEPALAVDGCRQMLWGFFKKLAIADRLAPTVDAAYSSVGTASGGELALATFYFAFQIYCDFSAYSDIAIGTARLFGFEIMRNFAYPYFSQDMGEFWRRWHISLSTWFRDYVFIPLGGSRVGKRRQSVNLLTTFTLSGLWHGAAWQYIAWGAANGLAVLPAVLRTTVRRRSAGDVPGGEGLLPAPGAAVRIALTFLAICAMWVFFRAPSFSAALTVFGKIGTAPFSHDWRAYIQPKDLGVLAVLISAEWVQRRRPHPLQIEGFPQWLRWTVYTCLIWGTFDLMPGQTSPFIYFQF